MGSAPPPAGAAWRRPLRWIWPEASADGSSSRIRRARLTALSSALAQGLTVLTGLVSVPLTVGYLGQQRYGVWLTISSLLMWVAISDLGLGGNALINAIAEAHGKDDRRWAQELVATAFWALVVVAVLMSVGFAAGFPYISWTRIFNVSAEVPQAELQRAALFAWLGFVLSFPLGVVVGVYHGYQEGYITNAWSILNNFASLLALIAVSQAHGGLPLLVLALWGARVLVTAASALHLFLIRKPWLWPAPRAASRRAVGRLFGLGSQYLIAQLAGIGLFQSQPMVIAQVLGPSFVGVFNVAQRLLALPLTAVQLLTFPLMPAYGEARARQDWPWIRRTLRQSTLLAAAVGAALTLLLAVFARPLITLWVGPAMVPSPALAAALAVYAFVSCLATPLSVTLFGLEKVGGQAVIATATAVGVVVTSIALARVWGRAGVAGAMAVAMLAVNLTGQALHLRSVMKAHAGEGSRPVGEKLS